MSYFGADQVVAGAVKVKNAAHSLIFDQQLIEPEDYFKSSRLEGVWWLPSRKSDMSLVISNTSEANLSAGLVLYGAQGHKLASSTISLLGHETRVVPADELVKNSGNLPEIGGVSINHTGTAGSVFAEGLIQDSSIGFSTLVDLQDPEAAASSRLNGAGLRIGQVAGERLTPIAVARNVVCGAFLQTSEDERIKNRVATIISQTVGRETEVKGVKVWTRTPPRREAVTEIKSFGDKAISPLSECLRDKDPRIRNQAVEFLGLLESIKAIDPLKKVALTDASPTSRQIALRWLSILPWEAVSAIIQQATTDPEVSVRNEARALIRAHKK